MLRDLITMQVIDDIFEGRIDAMEARHEAALDAAWDAEQAERRAARAHAEATPCTLDPIIFSAAPCEDLYDGANWFRSDLSITGSEAGSIAAGGGWCADPLLRELWAFHLIDICGDRDELSMSNRKFEDLGDAAWLAALDNWTPATDLAN